MPSQAPTATQLTPRSRRLDFTSIIIVAGSRLDNYPVLVKKLNSIIYNVDLP